MASFASACRLSARLTSRQLRQDATARGFRTSAAYLAAQNFTMPALSPTMTEGNIAKWAVKEGDSFSAGDVLLEIETDKASMDVEAQDDGVMAKITAPDGTKAIKVGTRIGVIAEQGDDLSTLEIPHEESVSSPSEGAKSTSNGKSEAQSQAPTTPKSSASKPAKKTSGKAEKQTRPLLPSVQALMHQHGLPESAVDEMTPSGPNNRLLKGDVLAYLGSIADSYPSELSTKLEKLSHLDLSNIKTVAPPAPKAPKPSESAAIAEPVIENLEVALPISMASVLEVQKRIQTTLGIFMPISTFIARAADVANDDLPRSKSYKPSADELFNQILGLDKVSQSGVRGDFMPQITALPPSSLSTRSAKGPAKKVDIIDVLSGKSRPIAPKISASGALPGVSANTNIFSLTVPKGDEKRAQVFLERVKAVLEVEPGRLIL
ncbi:single hybrid motif-containing protein [Coleophoma cylindrospora]|uniref:Single hybrid motif-containing protein n=1 Tax=Coleophoma cylindrospora TaxID=1849047 RepID=A0A3D8RB39_9HELO|nr:single hybrid motif-containing protein [Coleophoma cylindrospora]